MTKKIKIYFLQPTIVSGQKTFKTQSLENHNTEQVFINPTPLYLDSYIKIQDTLLHQNIEWKKFQIENITQEQLLKDLENNDINVLCVSVYIWNCKSTLDMLGCSIDFLKQYISNKFEKNMSWDNYGLYGWHIDHIIPLSSAKNKEELEKLCHYSNLQPLWAKDNLQKSNKIKA